MRLGDASEADMSAERPVLVVDDDPAVATLVATVLRRHALAVEIALDAPAALGRLRTTRYGAVLTDMTMPSMSGLELVRAARAADPQAPPFLVMTAYLDPARTRGCARNRASSRSCASPSRWSGWSRWCARRSISRRPSGRR
jgi:CheY-like chemotaxis protein